MPPPAPITETTDSPVEQIPQAEVIRRRLGELAYERSILRQLLKAAVRRERGLASETRQEAQPWLLTLLCQVTAWRTCAAAGRWAGTRSGVPAAGGTGRRQPGGHPIG